ncbi:putative leo1-like protein [Lupinus albus]|uniref:Putative leo1-like protein n=1 Tax=Lupinus albus TaxID=3870 RepID=A0A6A4QAB7_LUPAL|nr:putative leo1-like protein [Lupinus albus]
MEVEFGDQGEENESKEDTDSDTKDDGYIHRVVTSKNRGVVERDDDYEQVGKGRSPSGSPIDDRVQTRDLHSVPEMHDVFGDSDDEDEEVGYAVQHDIQQYSDRSPMEKEGSYGKGLKPVDLHSEEDHQYISEEENFEMKLKDKPLGPQLVLEVPLQPPPAPPENMHMIRVSNIMGVDPKPFDPKTYVEENTFLTDESGTKRRIRLENNIVRWRTVRNPDGTTSTESNARFVRWSDGSLQLLIGNEVLDTTVQDIQHDQAHLFRRHGQGILQSQGRLLRKMRFMPSSLSSNSHRQLTALVGSTQKKAYKVKSCITDIDPEREKRGNEKAFSQSIQSNVILNRKHEKVSQKYPPTVYRRRQLSPGFLDEDAETEYHKSPRSQHRFEVDLELEALAEKRIMNAKNSQGLKDIARKSSQAPANSSRHRIVYSDNDREESEYETDGEKDKRPISRKRTEDTEPEYVDDDEEEEHYEEDVQVNDASDEEKPKEKSKDIRGRFKGKGIESHEDSPRRKTSYRRKVIIYDSDEE